MPVEMRIDGFGHELTAACPYAGIIHHDHSAAHERHPVRGCMGHEFGEPVCHGDAIVVEKRQPLAACMRGASIAVPRHTSIVADDVLDAEPALVLRHEAADGHIRNVHEHDLEPLRPERLRLQRIEASSQSRLAIPRHHDHRNSDATAITGGLASNWRVFAQNRHRRLTAVGTIAALCCSPPRCGHASPKISELE